MNNDNPDSLFDIGVTESDLQQQFNDEEIAVLENEIKNKRKFNEINNNRNNNNNKNEEQHSPKMNKPNNENNNQTTKNDQQIPPPPPPPPVDPDREVNFIPYTYLPTTLGELRPIVFFDKDLFTPASSTTKSAILIFNVDPKALEDHVKRKNNEAKKNIDKFTEEIENIEKTLKETKDDNEIVKLKTSVSNFSKKIDSLKKNIVNYKISGTNKTKYIKPQLRSPEEMTFPFGWAPFSNDKGDLTTDIRAALDSHNEEHVECATIFEEFKKAYSLLYTEQLLNPPKTGDYLTPFDDDTMQNLRSDNPQDLELGKTLAIRMFSSIFRKPVLKPGEEKKDYHNNLYTGIQLNGSWKNEKKVDNNTGNSGGNQKKKLMVFLNKMFLVYQFSMQKLALLLIKTTKFVTQLMHILKMMLKINKQSFYLRIEVNIFLL